MSDQPVEEPKRRKPAPRARKPAAKAAEPAPPEQNPVEQKPTKKPTRTRRVPAKPKAPVDEPPVPPQSPAQTTAEVTHGPFDRLPRIVRAHPLAALLLGGLALRLLIAYVLFPGEGLGSDLRLFTRWADTMVQYGPGGFYAHAGFADYPPGFLWVLYALGLVGQVAGGVAGVASTDAIFGLVKMPAILADLAIALVLYSEGTRWKDRGVGLIAAAAFLFVPVTWYDSALWGQVDSFGTLLLLLSVVFVLRGFSEFSFATAVLAAVVKPQYAIVVGLVGAVLVGRHLLRRGSGPQPVLGGSLSKLDERLGGLFTRRQGVIRLVTSALLATAVGLLVILPFDLPTKASAGLAGIPIVGHVSGLAGVIGSAATFYSVLTANAFNLWAIVGPTSLAAVMAGDYFWTLDSLRLFGLPAAAIGTVLFMLVALTVAASVILRDRWRVILIAATVLAIAFFVLPTRVHERYLFPAFATGALLAAVSRRWLWWYVALGIVNVLNLHAILTLDYDGYGTPGLQALPFSELLRTEVVITALSLAHVALFGVAFVALLRQVFPARFAPMEARARAWLARISPPEPEPAPAAAAAVSAPTATAVVATDGVAVTTPARRRGRFGRTDAFVCLALFLVVFGTRAWRLETPRAMYFDEGLHVRSAMEFMQDWRYNRPHDLYEWTHPHLAKYLMAAGLMTLGGNRLAEYQFTSPGLDAAQEPVYVANSATGQLGGDHLAVATGAGVLIATHGDLPGGRFVELAGASAVVYDDGLFVGTSDGGLWQFADAASAPVSVGQVTGAVKRLWALENGRLLVATDSGEVHLFDLATRQVVATASLPGLANVVPVNVDSGQILLAAIDTGIATLDPATLTPTVVVPLSSPPVDMALVDGSERGHLDRSMLEVPTVFVALSNWDLATAEVNADGSIGQSRGMTMPGPVRKIAWDRSTNFVHVLGTSPEGNPTIYEVEPLRRVVFANADIAFYPSAWVLDVQSGEPNLNRERALAFSPSGVTAVVEIGNDSFAWRIPGVLAGALTAVLLYLLMRILFSRRHVALLVAVLIPLEGLLFSQSRIGMNDVYVGLFIVAAMTVLAFLLETRSKRWTGRWALALGLPTIGVLLGLALSSKWVAAYAIGTVVLLILLRSRAGRWIALGGLIALTAVLGWQALADRPPNIVFPALMVGLCVLMAALIARRPPDRAPDWVDPLRRRGLPFVWALVCLTVLPLAVYVVSYIPWALSAGGSNQLFAGWPLGHSGLTFLDLQVQMYQFHDQLRQQHGAASPWWAWPLGLKPVWGYFETFVDGTRAMIFGAGNPVLLWLSAAAVAIGGWFAWKRLDRRVAFLVICFLGAWLPWARIDRFTANYHYFVPLMFAVALLAWLLAEVWFRRATIWTPARGAVIGALLLPALMWNAKDPLCAIAGVTRVNAASQVCAMSIADVLLPVIVFSVAAVIVSAVVWWVAKPRQLVIGIAVAALIVFVALYPVLAAVRLPGELPIIYQGLLPTWESSFEFAANMEPYVSQPLVGLGTVALLIAVAALCAWIIRRGGIRRRGSVAAANPPDPMPESAS